ncbi:uncharacterized protein F5147DRAFT_658575 [Suillus discolor]|uniref:Uncharacterized protein n=1 Tax=Suillus discolor TaxID=1912936 RepID=A0A9P7ETS0_9AGAM|nr:uncharacterized protein F5147DRAFT_658575 [Suillus discolor]KAG2088828.1 hypothetical protein F5147DRAFT_658575 [Suillus discolor]
MSALSDMREQSRSTSSYEATAMLLLWTIQDTAITCTQSTIEFLCFWRSFVRLLIGYFAAGTLNIRRNWRALVYWDKAEIVRKRSNLKDSGSSGMVDCEGVSSTLGVGFQMLPLVWDKVLIPSRHYETTLGTCEIWSIRRPKWTSESQGQDTYLQPLRIFDSVMERLTDIWAIPRVHPYAKISLGVLSRTLKMVIGQSDRDHAVYCLVDKLDQVYRFMIRDETLGQISSMHGILGQISQQTLECACFIRDYFQTKCFYNAIQLYSDTLDALTQNFRDQLTRDMAIYVHRTGQLDLSGIMYAANAGLDTMK